MPTRKYYLALTLLFSLAAAGPLEAAVTVKLEAEGVAIDAGGMGQFQLNYPVLVGEHWDQIRKPIERRVHGATANIRFDSGASIEVSLHAASGEVTLAPSNLPKDAKTLRMDMLVDFKFAGGGSWKIGDGAETPFPAEKPAKPFLYQGNAERFMLRDSQGASLTVQTPPYSFQQLQDNREWGWKIFHWQFDVPNPAAGPMKLKIALLRFVCRTEGPRRQVRPKHQRELPRKSEVGRRVEERPPGRSEIPGGPRTTADRRLRRAARQPGKARAQTDGFLPRQEKRQTVDPR